MISSIVFQQGTPPSFNLPVHQIQSYLDLPCRNIRICGNNIYCPLEDEDIPASSDFAIGAVYSCTEYSGNTVVVNRTLGHTYPRIINMEIAGNTIVNFPMSGIRFQATLINCNIHDNMLINCGSTLDRTQCGAVIAYRTPVFIVPFDGMNLRIANNLFVDSNDTTRVYAYIFLYNDGTTANNFSNVEIVDNVFSTTGTDKSALNYQIYQNTDGTCPYTYYYVQGKIDDFLPLVGGGARYALGSRVVDTASGYSWTVNALGNGWVQEYQDSAAVDGWHLIDAAPDVSSTPMTKLPVGVGAYAGAWIAPAPCSLVSIFIHGDNITSTGSITFTVYVNETPTSSSLQLTDPAFGSITPAVGAITMDTGDRLAIYYSTTSDFSPTSIDYSASARVRF